MSTTTDQVLKRKDVETVHTWDLESVFATPEGWEKERQAVMAALPPLAGFKGKLGESPSVLADYLEAAEAMAVRAVRLMTYANMEIIVDTTSPEALALKGQAIGLFGQCSATVSFSQPELQDLGDILFEWADKELRLSIYRHYFEDLIRQRDHLRSAEVEQVLGLLIDPFSGPQATASALTDSDLQFVDAVGDNGEAFRVGQTTIPPTGIQSVDRERRRTAWESFSDGYLSVKNTLASNYLTCVKQRVFNIRVRSYESVLHSMLSPGNVPNAVFHNLIDTFTANLPTWHRYWEVRRRLLQVDTLHPYDQWAPLQDNEIRIPYEQAVDWCCDSMEPLGDEYVTPMRSGCTEERWVDYEPNIEKRQGAAAVGGGLGSTRNFLYTSYDSTLQAVSVLSHELGQCHARVP